MVAGIVAFNNVIDGFMASCDTFTRAGGCWYPAEGCCCDSASGQFGGVEKVHIVPRAGVLIFVDLGFLFACDLIADDSFLTCDLSTNVSFPDMFPHWSPQQSGLVCPCCGCIVP